MKQNQLIIKMVGLPKKIKFIKEFGQVPPTIGDLRMKI
jgi:hypothetical protein